MGDYFGYGPSYINGLGFRVKGERPVTNEFSKSILDEEEREYYYDEFGIKRRRKKGVTELSSIDVEEISIVDRPATKKTFMVIKNLEDKKGDERMLIELKPKELETVRETISILNKYELTGELLEARGVLISNFGTTPSKYPYPEREVKKYNERCEWSSVQRQIFGYTEDDLSFINDEDIGFEKSDPNDKFPSLTRQINLNKAILERRYEERELETRLV